MGEIIFAIFFGAWMVFLGVFLNISLTKEEKRYRYAINNEKTFSKEGGWQ